VLCTGSFTGMNVLKSGIVFSSVRPTICSACETRLSTKPLPPKFISVIKKEIKKQDKKLYYTLVDFTKSYPLIAISTHGNLWDHPQFAREFHL
jgi:hypothetical protein